MTEDGYVPLPPQVLEAMPDAQVVKRRLLDAIDTEYNLLVAARGEVANREDTYQTIRKVASWHEQAKNLKAVFDDARVRTASLLEDEMVAAVGEQDGMPNEKTLKVPDAAGDVVLTASTTNIYHIDVDSLISAATAVHLAGGEVAAIVDIVNGDHQTIAPDQLADVLAEICAGVVQAVLACGKFEPQVTKVRAYADAIARGGEDGLSGVVTDSIRKTVKTNGVTMKRKAN